MSQEVLVELGGLVLCIPANLLASYVGYYCRIAEDRDMLLPLSAIFFTFYPLIISLPQAHFKLMKYTIEQQNSSKTIDEDEIFPFAFLICLFSITACILFDKFLIQRCKPQQQMDSEEKKPIISNPNGLKFFLSLSIAFQNIVNYYYICMQENQTQILKQVFLFIIFSLLINFAFVYLLSEAEIDKSSILQFVLYTNFGLIAGYILSLLISPDILLLTLPCICAGIQVYCSIFICFPAIFSNGEDNTKDKFRYCSILITFLFIIIYYPICYLLRI